MLKQTVSYHDFDDNPTQETLYFNLTKSELADNLHLQDELDDIRKTFEEDQRSLTTVEIKKIIDLVKTFMRLSYGVRSADGKRFIKNDEQWNEFTQTAAYDAFLFSLFEEPNKAVVFMTGILPKDLRSAATDAVKSGKLESSVASALSSIETEGANEPYKTLEHDATLPELTPEQMEQAARAWQAQQAGK